MAEKLANAQLDLEFRKSVAVEQPPIPTIHDEDALIAFGGKEHVMFSFAPETKKNAVTVTGDEFGEYKGIGELRKKAIDYYVKHLQGTSVFNEELGRIDIDKNGLIEFTSSDRKKVQSTGREKKKLLLIKHLPELLKNGYNVRTAESTKEKHKEDSFVYMNNEVEIDGNRLPVHITLVKRNNGEIQYYNHNFIKESEKHASEPARPESSNEALGTLPDSVFSKKTISQEEDASKPKFSMDANEEQSFFRKAYDKFAKRLHLNGDKIVTEEDQKKAHRLAQEKAMDAYLKEQNEETRKRLHDLGVTKGQLRAYKNGESYDNEISLRQYAIASPSRIADKVSTFRAFYRMGERAMDKLVRLRSKYARKYNQVMSLVKSKEEREKLFGLLWQGDFLGKEFGTLTDAEIEEIKASNPENLTQAIQRAKIEKICKENDVSENVAEAYLGIRRLITSAYHMINEARRHPQILTKHLAESEIEELKQNKFVTDVKVSEEKDASGRRRVTFKQYEYTERQFYVTPSQLSKMEKDDAIQVLSVEDIVDNRLLVRVREGIPDLAKRKGYIPHLFHNYLVVVKDAKGNQVSDILFTAQSEREAIKLAEEWKKHNQLKDGEQLYISPRGMDEQLGMNADMLAPVMGDKNIARMLQTLAEKHDMTLEEAREFVNGAVKQKNRHRFLGNLLERKGATGFVEDMDWVLQHYFRIASRYAALESEFKPQAISLFERVFGAFDNDYSKNPLAQYTKQYIEDVNGNPTTVELILNRMLNKTKFFRLFVKPTYGERGALTITNGLTRTTAYLKLGFLNVSSAMLNLTQLINAAGYIGWGKLERLGKVQN